MRDNIRMFHELYNIITARDTRHSSRNSSAKINSFHFGTYKKKKKKSIPPFRSKLLNNKNNLFFFLSQNIIPPNNR